MAAHLQTMTVLDMPTQQLSPPLKRRGGGFDRLGSRRAKAACTLCRWRKVRCDAEDGQPCSNCSFEHVQCVLTPRKRRMKTCDPSKSYVSPVATEMRTTDSPYQIPTRPFPERLTSQEQQSMSIQTRQSVSHSPMSNEQPEPAKISKAQDQDDLNAFAMRSLPEPMISPVLSADFSANGRTFSMERSLTAPTTPLYLKPLPQHLGMDDIEYLHRKGALSVPDPDLRDALLRSYIEFVHPCLPILDLRSFQDSIQNPNEYSQLSYPLFQAVMFAGAAWVDIKPLRKLGFLTRMAARKAFYQKARVGGL
jgi:hypothetical protein